MTRTIRLGFLTGLLCLGSAVQAHAAAQYGAPPQTCSQYGSPGHNQAFIWTGAGYSNPCYVLQIDDNFGETWSSWDATTGLPNDQIKGYWTGPDVTLVLFWNSFYTYDNGAPNHFGPNQYNSTMGNWDNKASAARLQKFNYGQCGTTPERLVLYTDANFGGDCTEIKIAESCYRDPVAMGFRNDTLSSAKNTSTKFDALLWVNASYAGSSYTLAHGQSWTYLSGFNDVMSSLEDSGIRCR